MNGFTRAQKALIAARDLDCVIHHGNIPMLGTCEGDLTHHHRKNRGHGGVKSRNRVANGLLICTSANSRLTHDTEFMRYAYAMGWLLRSDHQIDSDPVFIPRLGQMVYFNDAGDYLTERKAA